MIDDAQMITTLVKRLVEKVNISERMKKWTISSLKKKCMLLAFA